MAEADINSPPAEDSLKNIVNILNDYCLQLVLLKLKRVDDFWSAAQVCNRFRGNAIACFAFKNVNFEYRSPFNNENVIFFDSAKDFLNLFGPRIKSIQCDFKLFPKDIGQQNHDDNLSLISQYCGPTLNELEINGDESRRMILHLRSPFHALEHFKVFQISFFRFDPSLIPQLKHLEIEYIRGPMDWLVHQFPMLQRVSMFDVPSVTDEIFIDFQKRNPQMLQLHCYVCKGLTPSVWENIGNRLPNIVELGIDTVGMNIGHLSTLQHLRQLQLFQHTQINGSERESLFQSLAEKDQPIEELEIYRVDFALGRILKELKTIKVLHIHFTPEQIVLDLVKYLPALEQLFIYDVAPCSHGIHLLTLGKILESCKTLTKVEIVGNLAVDGTIELYEHLNEYESIIALVKGRVKLSFNYLKTSRFNYDTIESRLEDLLPAYNNDWIRFSKC